MWSTMKNNLLGKKFLSCFVYLYRFHKYVSYGFPIINCYNPGVHHETPCIRIVCGNVRPISLPCAGFCFALPVDPMKAYCSLTSVLDGGEWSALRFGRFTSRERTQKPNESARGHILPLARLTNREWNWVFHWFESWHFETGNIYVNFWSKLLLLVVGFRRYLFLWTCTLLA